MAIHDWFFFIYFIFAIHKAETNCSKTGILLRHYHDCECGEVGDMSYRIIGGKETTVNSHPWMVGVYLNGHLFCGGSLINDRYVLTAAHCLSWVKKEDLTVALGMHSSRGKRKVWKVQNFTIHEDMTSDELHETNDIALLKLEKPVKFSSRISPICLPTKGSTFVGREATVSGWGKVATSSGRSDILRKTTVKVMSNEECSKNKKVGNHVVESSLCAFRPGSDSCQGDSGGPLTLELAPGRWYQIGLVSWGLGCADPDSPGFYTRLSHFYDWIALHTADAFFCKELLTFNP